MNNNSFLERQFKLSEHNTDVRTEVIAGFTTFMTMAYILIVNPLMLSAEGTGMSFPQVFTATALSSVIAILVMAFFANLPFALAPGMGLNAFFVYTVVFGMGKSFEFALTAVFLEGLIFIALSFLNVREAIINSIPMVLKKAISVGIGLFIATIGLMNSGLVITNAGTPIALGNLLEPTVILAMLGLFITGILLVKNVKGALFIGIIATTLIGFPMGITQMPETLVQAPAAPYFFRFEWSEIFTGEMLFVLVTFLFVDMFDTVGTLVGVATKADMLTEDGKVPNAKQALLADAVGTTVGAIFGTSTVTTYVESASGVTEGGRTGLTALTTGLLFAVALFLSPLFLMIPGAATAPALILVGMFMMSPVKDINFDDYSDAIPAFLTMIMMPMAYSISEGIVFGVVSYVILKLAKGKTDEIHPLTYVIALAFIVFKIMGLTH